MDKIGLFLDDLREPLDIPKSIDRWYIVKNYKEFCDFIVLYVQDHGEFPHLISLDHDLHTDHYVKESKRRIGAPIMYSQYHEKTGKECAEWLCEYSYNNKIPLNSIINIHSENEMGAGNMRWFLEKYIKQEGYEGIVINNKWKYK